MKGSFSHGRTRWAESTVELTDTAVVLDSAIGQSLKNPPFPPCPPCDSPLRGIRDRSGTFFTDQLPWPLGAALLTQID
jgi:hypothetical protein